MGTIAQIFKAQSERKLSAHFALLMNKCDVCDRAQLSANFALILRSICAHFALRAQNERKCLFLFQFCLFLHFFALCCSCKLESVVLLSVIRKMSETERKYFYNKRSANGVPFELLAQNKRNKTQSALLSLTNFNFRSVALREKPPRKLI